MVINNLIEIFSYSFMIRALIVGVLLSFCAALIGTPLVLRKNSMIGDGLSHVGFGAFAIASVLGLAPIQFAIPIVIIASFFILQLTESNIIHGDAAIALVSISALAVGTFIVSLTGTNVDINSYLFGSILSISNTDILITVILTIAISLLYLFSHHQIFSITFDETFAKSIGVNTKLYHLAFAVLCSIVVVLGMRLMGALLISGLIIFPVLSAGLFSKTYRSTIISSALIAILAFLVGLIASYSLNTPTGATIIIVNLVFFIILKFSNLLSSSFKS